MLNCDVLQGWPPDAIPLKCKVQQTQEMVPTLQHILPKEIRKTRISTIKVYYT